MGYASHLTEKNQKSQDHYHQSTSEVAKERDQVKQSFLLVHVLINLKL